MARNPLEMLRRGFLTGPMVTKAQSASNQFAGRTTLNSGSATVAVSCSTVKSDSIIQYGIHSDTRQDSGVGSPIEVMSIIDGSGFAFGTSGGETIARDTTVMWSLMNTS